jgi:hypothetical protein
MRVSLRRPAPATLISLVALGCALGGTSYAAATIGTADLQSNAVTSAKVKNGAIKLVDLGAGSVGPGKIRAQAVTTPKLRDLAVTTPKLADGSVDSAKLADAGVTSADLAPGSVGTTALADDAVTGAKVKDGTILSGDIGDQAIQAVDIKDGEVVKGQGFMFFNTLTIPNGAANVQVLNAEGLGRLLVSCAAGQATTKIQNTSTGDIVIVSSELFRDTGAPADPAVKADVDAVHRYNPGPGGVVAQDSNQGTGGIQSVQWQLSAIDAQAVKHVATLWTTAGAVGADCSVTAQALATT